MRAIFAATLLALALRAAAQTQFSITKVESVHLARHGEMKGTLARLSR